MTEKSDLVTGEINEILLIIFKDFDSLQKLILSHSPLLNILNC